MTSKGLFTSPQAMNNFADETPPGATTPQPGTETPQYGTHRGRRLRKFLKPDGRRVHIAATPEEHLRLTQTLPHIEPDDNFEVHIHGSGEHLNAVRELHAYHEQRHHALKSKHTDIYQEFENVRADLDLLSDELNLLTDHGVSLDANFSKYGYDAHIRTKDPYSSSNSISDSRRSSSTGRRDWEAEQRNGTAIKFYRRPVVRQYFHKGFLWRASEVEEVASFELFVDLLYVGIIAVIGDRAAEDATGFGLLRFSVTFILGWKMWSDLTLVISWFEIDDIIQRICVLFVLICLFGFTLNIVSAFETSWIQLISFYLAQRMFNAVYYAWIGYVLPMVRGYMYMHIICILIPAALWIVSIQIDYPDRYAIIWVALFLDLFAVIAVIFCKRWAEKEHPIFCDKYIHWFDFFPAMNIEHKTERTNAFVTLVFGYSVVALLYQNQAAFGINAFFGKAVLGLIQAFSFNWLYFEIDAWNVHTHAIRRHIVSSMVWITSHLPFIMGYVLAGAALSRLVLATDCADANVEDLTENYTSKSESEVPNGLRWFYCCGLGIALMSMTFISISHVHKDFEGQRLPKRYRLPVRFAVAIILICLPLAESLTSLGLIATTTCLVVFVLIVDLYGSTSVHDTFWRCTQQCRYRTECSVKKNRIVTALKNGETINLSEMQDENSATEKGFNYEVM